MLVKTFCLGAVLVSTPLCLMTPQGKEPARSNPAAAKQDPRPVEAPSARQREELDKLKLELDGARRDLAEMRRQLGEVLDTLDTTFARDRDRSCSPSRNRSLMSHFQWLDKNSHQQRAAKALATIVEQAGDNVDRLNGMAWELMTDKETTGQFDRVALALAERMEASGRNLRHHYIDTIALARFLNGQVDQAIDLQQKAIAAGGDSDDYRRRLRTYQAAQSAVLVASKAVPAAAGNAVAVAVNDDE